jgi:hypothetical protein
MAKLRREYKACKFLGSFLTLPCGIFVSLSKSYLSSHYKDPRDRKTGAERSEMPREKSEIQLLQQEEGGKQFSFLRFANLVGAE